MLGLICLNRLNDINSTVQQDNRNSAYNIHTSVLSNEGIGNENYVEMPTNSINVNNKIHPILSNEIKTNDLKCEGK